MTKSEKKEQEKISSEDEKETKKNEQKEKETEPIKKETPDVMVISSRLKPPVKSERKYKIE